MSDTTVLESPLSQPIGPGDPRAVVNKPVTNQADTAVPVTPGSVRLEIWRNGGASRHWVSRIGQYGARYQEIIAGYKTFSISPEERRLNQNIVARPEYDPFTNGTFQPVTLLDDEPDTDSLRTNPNVFDDEVGVRIFKMKGEKFRDRVSMINNATAISRLLDMARDPKNECTLQQFEYIKLRQGELQDAEAEGAQRVETPSGGPTPVAL